MDHFDRKKRARFENKKRADRKAKKTMESIDISSVYYLDGVVVAPDFVFLATQLNTLDPRETAHTRMSTYNPAEQELPFGYFDLEDNIVSVHAYRTLPPDKKRFVCLGAQGAVHFVRGSTREVRTERISGAGMLEGSFGGLMSHLREIDGQLWACGQHGQVYRRFGVDDWRENDQGIRVRVDPAQDGADRIGEMLEAISTAPMLSCIDGTGASDVYVVGLRGFMAHFDGEQWTEIGLPVSEHLEWVRCNGPDEVWVCGHNGTLLKGSARTGFRRLGRSEDRRTFVCLAPFDGAVYLSTEDGLFRFDGQSISRVKSKLKPELQDAWRLDRVDGVLWSIGIRDLARFDGRQWVRIHHPDNEPIRR
ncbi:hypothetical protein [Variovorax sp. 160MFSha2.1]|uniref:hypothetical protein n=1 Tax=Variovorax sp. 160MFSha2.1 TaxID=3158367 RepID=UPI003AAD0F19